MTDNPSRMKRKQNQVGDQGKVNNYDTCQTPFYALDPLLPYLDRRNIIWEPAAGEGQIVRKLELEGFSVVASDLLSGENYFEHQPPAWDCSVTNPPFSIKYEWLEMSYELGKPFALLMPLETLGSKWGQGLFEKNGVEIILLNRRINFKMPFKGWDGTAQFPTAWFTWGLEIGETLTYGKIVRYPDEQMPLLKGIGIDDDYE